MSYRPCSTFFAMNRMKTEIFVYDIQNTVNSEIFARILFSRIALKDIFVTLKIRD